MAFPAHTYKNVENNEIKVHDTSIVLRSTNYEVAQKAKDLGTVDGQSFDWTSLKLSNRLCRYLLLAQSGSVE